MGIWDKLKGFFGNEPGEPPKPDPRTQPLPSPPGALFGQPATAGVSASTEVPTFRGDPYRIDILGLSQEEMRKRALKIDPLRTAWIGRTDTIPPQSDERTALIDRGLMLRGFLTKEQLDEIHAVGDGWLEHHEAVKLAEMEAHKIGKELIEQRKQEKVENKARRKREAEERKKRRVEEIARRKAEDIVYLGRGVSAGLSDRRADIEKLGAMHLPVLSSPADLARALGISVPRLRFLAFHSEAAERTHYAYFEVPKRSGGTRKLSAPLPSLKKAQLWILKNVLEPLAIESPAHGFVRGRSTVSNAAPHLGRDVIVNLDLEEFFPTITFRRVRGLFARLGYSPAVATLLGLLSTEPPREKVLYDGEPYWVAVGERRLPQGAPTSPAISNQIAKKLDRRLTGMATKLGWTYTRYADDLTFSAAAGKRGEIGRLMAKVRHVVQDEGFRLHRTKGRVQRRGRRQTVTGVVVNGTRPRVPREEVRRLRAILFEAKKTGLAAQNRDDHPHFEAHLRGKIAYVMMIDRPKGIALKAALDAVIDSARPISG
jgi:RNA-directed DNA polymerase